ncbi:peptidoglycan editing factor PgeF [Candidatus Synechococcus calcipolaris G9]|uniref:Purine nucleoside phosphorylase n=1 Tax=Candidatus Synechococcus calcipolaris G9 TaxID=1497997 RepID=A0ABT6EV18_9SYNE|nr:peptidoglycan editing factor PgeF [Candidatus Synechococcus calcipolaris]MDG2989665.1 peptidoglycan editing factor PgeF [Candidatus Synechococcus calcipolaris G9]
MVAAPLGWQWQTTLKGTYLTCDRLAGMAHGFFTREWVEAALADLTGILQPGAIPLRTKQVHGNRVVLAGDILAQGETATYLDADALISTGPNQALWVCSADCVPVLIGDRQTGRVAAIHAGWRGTSMEVVPKTIQTLCQLGSALPDLAIALGPAISGTVYQVGLSVAIAIGETLVSLDSHQSPEEQVAHLQAQTRGLLLPDPEPGRVRLDVRQANVLQLLKMGLEPDQISVSPLCTYREPEQFFSYRRERLKQVQWSGITSF